MGFVNHFLYRLGFKPSVQIQADISTAPEINHYLREDGLEKTRIHLRIDGDGQGLLMINASRVYHLNPTAARMARFILDEIPIDQAVKRLTRQFHVNEKQARKDFLAYTEQFQALLHPDGACPICDLDLETTLPFTARPSAPYRMDLALTYRCNNDCGHCYNARPRSFPEIATEDWKRIIDICWNLGIPHIVFTGGEPTLRDDLPELIQYAENNGQITGINTNGRRLSDPDYVKTLVDAGLDHVQITLESHDSLIHDAIVQANGAWKQTILGLQNVLATRLYVMTNTTLLQSNSLYLEDTLDFLAQIKVPTIGLNALIHSGRALTISDGLPEGELSPLLELARNKTLSNQQKLIWYTPTEYCHFDPIQMNLGVKGCTAALYNMCIEPDGSVIPCQSYYQSLGRILENDWSDIWNHPLAVRLRERQDLPSKCKECNLMVECGGGCPLPRINQTG